MARIIVDSVALESLVNMLDLECAILEQCTDEDDLDTVEDCTLCIQNTSNDLRQIIRDAAPADDEQFSPGIRKAVKDLLDVCSPQEVVKHE